MKDRSIYISIALLICVSEVHALDEENHFFFVEHGGRSQWEIRSDINRHLSYRLTGHKSNMLIERHRDMIEHSANFQNKSVASLLDWHPMGGSFRITGGIFITSNEMDFISEPVVDYYFPGMSIDIDKSRIPRQIEYDAQSLQINADDVPDQISIGGYAIDVDVADVPDTLDIEAGVVEIDVDAIPDTITVDPFRVQIDREDINVTGTLKFKPVAPYLGFGWSNKPGSNKRLRFSIDIGLMYQSYANLDLRLNGRILDIHPELNRYLYRELAVAQGELQKKAEKLRFLPYASVGLSLAL